MKNIAIIRFPGSNCDFDALRFFRKHGYVANFVFHSEQSVPKDTDVVFLPGGFAFGDRDYEKATGDYTMNPGVLASRSNIMKAIQEGVAGKKFLTIGVCNGFQILVHMGLLRGRLERNILGKFYCGVTPCVLNKDLLGLSICAVDIPVAHGYGRYVFEEDHAGEDVFLRYEKNPNGSENDVAGVCNLENRVFGMMPHPERDKDSAWFLNIIQKYA